MNEVADLPDWVYALEIVLYLGVLVVNFLIVCQLCKGADARK